MKRPSLAFCAHTINSVRPSNANFPSSLANPPSPANFVLSETVERLFAPNPDYGKDSSAKHWLLADSYIGTLLVRGENVANAMSVDLDTEEELRRNQQMASEDLVRRLSSAWVAEKKKDAARKSRAQKKKGLEGDIGMEG